MREWLTALLREPATGERLVRDGDVLVSEQGVRYPVRDEIPRFVGTTDSGQKQTSQSFGFKWRQHETYASPGQVAMSHAWLMQRYGFPSDEAMGQYFRSRERILDAGCGAGYSAAILLQAATETPYVGVDISEAVDVAAARLSNFADAAFVQADLLALPFAPESFDTILSEGVLHHTPSTEHALRALIPLLARGGELLFYVYRRKGPVREFSDDAIRARIASLPPELAWEAMRPLTQLARALAEAKVEVTVPDVDLLEIKAGTYDVQRLIYNTFCKLFWNENFTFEENVHVNFDWYHPRYAHRQTEVEVREWCASIGLRVVHMDIQDSGITTRAVRD